MIVHGGPVSLDDLRYYLVDGFAWLTAAAVGHAVHFGVLAVDCSYSLIARARW